MRSDGILFISGCWLHERGAADAAAHEVEASAAGDAYILHARLQGAVFYALPCCTSLTTASSVRMPIPKEPRINKPATVQPVRPGPYRIVTGYTIK